MLHNAHFVKRLLFQTVLIDAWYASMKVMKAIEALDKVYNIDAYTSLNAGNMGIRAEAMRELRKL